MSERFSDEFDIVARDHQVFLFGTARRNRGFSSRVFDFSKVPRYQIRCETTTENRPVRGDVPSHLYHRDGESQHRCCLEGLESTPSAQTGLR